MFPLQKRPQKLLPKLISTLGLTAGVVLLAIPVAAHRVETAADVGGTLHIEPNDQPRAGTPSLAWFALTRQGGESIALAECNCNLAVYADPHAENDAPLQEPSLKAISAEGYTEIPGAEITFPQVGSYDLVLSGEPVAEGDFQPFELSFPITVATGQAAATPGSTVAPTPAATPSASPTPEATPSTANGDRFVPTLVSIAIFLGVFGSLILRSRRKRG
jgi:hypothetical protein